LARVTQRVDPVELDDLLERPRRAAIAFSSGGGIEPVPVACLRHAGRLWIGAVREALPAAGTPGRAVLLIDDGRYWFELRAVLLRVRLVAAPQSPPTASAELAWFEAIPDRMVAWDYAALREEADA